MKKMLTNNLGIKILSLVLAMMAWLVIVNIADPTTTRQFRDIPVGILNQDSISSIDQVFEIVEGATVDVTAKGKRSVVDSLKMEDFKATADLSNLSPVNAAAINVVITKNLSASPELDWNNQMMKVNLEYIKSKQVKLTVKPNGEVKNGYYLGDYEVTPNIIEVSGGKSKINKISSVQLEIDVNNVTKDFNVKVQPKAYDEEGDIIDTSNITFGVSEVLVGVNILKTKSVPVLIEKKGEPSEGYQFIRTVHQPETIKIAGSEKVLAAIDNITIPIDISGAKSDIEKEMQIEDYISDNVKIVDDNKAISIRAVIYALVKKTITYTVSEINIKNKSNDMNIKYTKIPEIISVDVMGLEKDINNLAATDVELYVDLDGLGIGNHNCEIKYIFPENITIASEVQSVRIVLTKSTEESSMGNATASPGETSSPLPTIAPTETTEVIE